MNAHVNAPAGAIAAVRQHLIETKDSGDPFEMLSKKFGQHADETLRQIESAKQETAAVGARLHGMEQKMARGEDYGGVRESDTWGRQLVREIGDQVKGLSEANRGSVSLSLKALTNDAASAGDMQVPTRDSTNLLPKQRLTIRALLPVVSISTGTVEYVQQTSAATGAAMVAEGALKPESDMDFSLLTTPTRVIAHWIKASRQVMEDLPQLRDLIDNEMRYGLALREEAQILLGDGTGQNLAGLVPAATAFDDPLGLITPNMIDTIGAAILQNALADYPATGIVVHAADWVRMRLLKDADGKYLLGDPQTAVEPRLFGLPVVPTKAMAVGDFLVGDFASAATLYDRWQPRVEVGYVNDDFVRNLTTILAEERVALAVKNPEALTYGSFAA